MLNPKQYCVVVDPVGADGRPQLGSRQLRNGPASFFLLPGEGRGGEGRGGEGRGYTLCKYVYQLGTYSTYG